MGQKVNPIGLRLGVNRTWDSRWFANSGEYGRLLHEDLAIRNELEKDLKQAVIANSPSGPPWAHHAGKSCANSSAKPPSSPLEAPC